MKAACPLVLPSSSPRCCKLKKGNCMMECVRHNSFHHIEGLHHMAVTAKQAEFQVLNPG